MRIAVLADIHGNLVAFEAALKHIAQQGADQLILLGDIINGMPDSVGCWQLAKSLNCPMLRGNHERYVAHFGTPLASPDWSMEKFQPLQWTVAQFAERDIRQMEQLPGCLRLPGIDDMVFVHASARDDHDTVGPFTSETTLESMFAGVREPWIIRGHNHIAQVRLWEDRRIVTSSSVGLPLDGNPSAQYLLLDKTQTGWQVRHQSVHYDVERALCRFHETGCLEGSGPMGRLYYRELMTGAHYMVPFLRYHARQGAGLPLAQAVEQFLSL